MIQNHRIVCLLPLMENTYTGEDEMERESKIAEELKWKRANENKDYNWAWAFN